MPGPVRRRSAAARRSAWLWWPTRWAIWGNEYSLVAPVLVVEAAALALCVVSLIGNPPDAAGAVPLAIVGVLAVVHTELARGIERTRWRLREELHVDLSSTWIFAAAVLLSPGMAALAAVVVDAYSTMRTSGHSRPLYRHVFSTATLMLAALAASSVMRYTADVGGSLFSGPPFGVVPIVLGMLVFLTVNTCLVAGAIAISNPRTTTLSSVVGEWDENLVELASYCLGAIAAAALIVNPWLVLLVLPPLLVLHRAVLVRQLAEQASTDDKTGLLNAAAWHNRAERELRRRQSGPRAVLVVDLDHFKEVNDRHGHLAGDEVLAAVADALRVEVRDRDVVGRFGGEEFVVLLGALGPGEDGPAELTAVAERIRRRIAALRVEMPTPDGPLTVAGLTVSVGAALYPDHGRDVRSLMHVADTALYVAKRAGRNTVRMGMRPPGPAPVEPSRSR